MGSKEYAKETELVNFLKHSLGEAEAISWCASWVWGGGGAGRRKKEAKKPLPQWCSPAGGREGTGIKENEGIQSSPEKRIAGLPTTTCIS